MTEEKKEVISGYNRNILTEVLAFSKKAENFRLKRKLFRQERSRRERLLKK